MGGRDGPFERKWERRSRCFGPVGVGADGDLYEDVENWDDSRSFRRSRAKRATGVVEACWKSWRRGFLLKRYSSQGIWPICIYRLSSGQLDPTRASADQI